MRLPGDTVVLQGHKLAETTSLQFVHANPQVPPPPAIAPTTVTDETITFTLPVGGAALPAGRYAVSAVKAADTPPFGAVPLSLAPQVTNAAAVRDAAGLVTVTVDYSPAVVAHQDASLMLSEKSAVFGAVAAPTTTLAFTFPDIAAGAHALRLRVDGVDSLLVDRSATPPTYDPSQKVDVP